MNIRVAIACLLLASVFSGCATGGFEDKSQFSDAYMTRHGFISIDFRRQPESGIWLQISGGEDTPDEFLIGEWQKYAQRLTKGHPFKGRPAIQMYEYTQGYSLLQPYAMGQRRKLKRAEGAISISS